MNIEQLIKEKCIGGVDFEILWNICKPLPKWTLKTHELLDDGFPVINSWRWLYGYYSNFNNEWPAFTIAARWEYAWFVNYFDEKFWAWWLCYPYWVISDKVNTKFVYYYLKSKQQYIMDTLVARGSIPALNKSDVDKIKIPVPPVEIQNEIVNILDKFTELEKELETELQARKIQYRYYREKLFTFENQNYIEWKKLSELFPFIRNWFVWTVTPYFTDEDNWVRYLEWTNIHNWIISDNEVLYVTKEFHQKHIKNELKSDDILMVQSWHIWDCAVVWDKYKWANCHALIIMSNWWECLSKYVVHYFHSINWFKQLTPAITWWTIKHVLAGKMWNIKIPVPPLEEQKRIVTILDNMEKLINDTSEWLPAEIQMRHQQYEYYRDKLLTFN